MATLSTPPTPTSPSSFPIPWRKQNPSLNPFSSSSSFSSTPAPQEDSRPHHPSSPPTIEVEAERPSLDSRSELASSGECPSSDTLGRPQPPPVSPTPAPFSSLSSPSKVTADTPAPSLFHVSFNQDQSFFAAGTDSGFRIFSCHPFRELFRRDFDGSGIGIVEMLFRCNILALVGGGACPYYPRNRVMIWDDYQGRCTGELTFRSEVLAVRLRRDVIVVVLEQKILVYHFTELKLVQQIETVPNAKGLCAVSQQQGSLVLVCPGNQKGQIRVEHYGIRRTKFIMAHDSRIACLALSQDGRLVATASSKGTLVRIFSSTDGTLLQEVRRGADRAEIHSLAFSVSMKWLAVSSDKGTVHVFSLKVNFGATINSIPRRVSDPKVPTSSQFSFIKGMLPKYFNSEWSVAQFRLRQNVPYIVAFGPQRNTVVILGMDGSFFRCQFDPEEGGEMKQLENYNFLKPHAC